MPDFSPAPGLSVNWHYWPDHVIPVSLLMMLVGLKQMSKQAVSEHGPANQHAVNLAD